MYDIIIIGAGPAGLSAAIYALRANKKVLILEANVAGGQIINANEIENYPGIKNISGFELISNMLDQVTSLNGEIKYEKVLEVTNNYEVKTKNNTYQAKGIIVATGLERNKLENTDNLPNISYCATCDGAFYKGLDVAVVGSGNQAVEDCIYLSNIVNKVYLIVRKDYLKAHERTVEKLKQLNNVEVIYNWTITGCLESDGKLESITINNDTKINVNGLFIAIGLHPTNEFLKGTIELTNEGYISSKDGVHTSKEHVYVAGDTKEKDLRQLVTAVSDGAIAATMCINEIK